EIVFPAAILQAPFFDINADPAVNYGAIGAVIGHEMGHGFDDQGSKSDWAGIQQNWWTDADRARFEIRVKTLGAQYNGFCPLDKVCVNGALTMGENIGDLGGLSMAYTAYKLSLDGKPAPIIDGLTGDQRFFLSWAQVWKSKYRDETLVNQIKSDPHSPGMYRANGPLRNFDPWYAAFDVKPGDKMYLPPEQRVSIW
ncbi:MAG: M13 family metallopeptidase, partial [Pseudomonadota bacterium]|nr:M13 family metallopeptidase [Pseudomonadota bacterium]